MNLLGVRQQLVALSGRYDLATTSVESFDTDAGADFFINAGTRFLDRKFKVRKNLASLFEELASGAWYLTFQNCFAVSEVWCNDDESRWKLTKYSYTEMKQAYTGLVSSTDGGAPLFYCPIWLRSVDATDFQSLGTFFNYVKSDDDGTYNGIMFLPKTDDSYNIEVVGKFYATELSDNDDTNFWSVAAPEILLKAALHQIEVFNRNSEGARDWLQSIELEARGMEFEEVEQESNEQRVVE